MPGRADDHASALSERPANGLPEEPFHKIIEASKRARCVVRVIMSEPGMSSFQGTDLSTDTEIRILVITEDFHIKGWLYAEGAGATEPPLLAYLAEYDEVSELLALRAGFSDVLHPQMSERILTERIMAAWNRRKALSALPMHDSLSQSSPRRPFELDLINRVFTIEGRAVALSKTEVQLLQVLGSNLHRPVSREEIHEAVSGDSYYDSRVVDSHIKRLRKKFGDAGISQNIIKTIYGLGYRIDATA